MQARSRRHAPKVRSGCRTCKKRRVKCDETQPRCLRCVKGQYICDGYDIIRPLTVVLLDSDQKRSLAYYKERTATTMSSFRELEFWTRVVPQCANSEEAVQRMVVALGALHEASFTAPGQLRGPGVLALEEYGKAITLVSRYGNSMDPGILLLLMVLFLFYDGMAGNAATTLKHLNAATQIYASLEFSQISRMTHEVVQPVLHQLRRMATALDMKVYAGPQGTLRKTVRVGINSFKDADNQINDLTETTSNSTLMFASMAQSEQHHQLTQLRMQLKEWKGAYARLSSSKIDSASPCMAAASAYIGIRYRLLEVRLRSDPFVPGHTLEGAHLAEIKRLVACCQSLFDSLNAGIWDPKAVFKDVGLRMDPTVILSYLLMHCHHPAIRVPVLRLLKIWCRDHGRPGDATSLPDLNVLADVMTVLYGLDNDWKPRSIVQTGA